MNKVNSSALIPQLIYLLVWVVLILIHSFAISGEKEVPFFWQESERYYSTWCLDLLLIAIWYFNYYVLTPVMIKRRFFTAYVVVLLLLMTLGVFFQLALYYLWEIGMPSHPFGAVPSLFGGISVLALMALGLSIRGVQNWVKLEKQVETLLEERKEKLATITELREKLASQPVDSERTLPHTNFNDLEGEEPLMWEDNELGIPQPEEPNTTDEKPEKNAPLSPP